MIKYTILHLVHLCTIFLSHMLKHRLTSKSAEVHLFLTKTMISCKQKTKSVRYCIQTNCWNMYEHPWKYFLCPFKWRDKLIYIIRNIPVLRQFFIIFFSFFLSSRDYWISIPPAISTEKHSLFLFRLSLSDSKWTVELNYNH